ncbi:hypothetical protein M0R45_019626 [Rubus argutus]|uniref:Uncharacterized protein n=1 Tax=Rubus argutus TaxID=59490 RepID=A0AAW1X9G1_RUBAR
MVNGNVGSDSINTYVGCGNLGMAISVFEALEFNDIISWSTIISEADSSDSLSKTDGHEDDNLSICESDSHNGRRIRMMEAWSKLA